MSYGDTESFAVTAHNTVNAVRQVNILVIHIKPILISQIL